MFTITLISITPTWQWMIDGSEHVEDEDRGTWRGKYSIDVDQCAVRKGDDNSAGTVR
jgi:hypothetical protein